MSVHLLMFDSLLTVCAPPPLPAIQLMMLVQKLITNRKVQEQQLALANQATYLNQLAMQNGMMGASGMTHMDLLGLYQQLHGLGSHQGVGKSPGPSKGL